MPSHSNRVTLRSAPETLSSFLELLCAGDRSRSDGAQSFSLQFESLGVLAKKSISTSTSCPIILRSERGSIGTSLIVNADEQIIMRQQLTRRRAVAVWLGSKVHARAQRQVKLHASKIDHRGVPLVERSEFDHFGCDWRTPHKALDRSEDSSPADGWVCPNILRSPPDGFGRYRKNRPAF